MVDKKVGIQVHGLADGDLGILDHVRLSGMRRAIKLRVYTMV